MLNLRQGASYRTIPSVADVASSGGRPTGASVRRRASIGHRPRREYAVKYSAWLEYPPKQSPERRWGARGNLVPLAGRLHYQGRYLG